MFSSTCYWMLFVAAILSPCFSYHQSGNFDTGQPIVRVSPTKGNAIDWFGFSVAVHTIDQIHPSDTLHTALAKTRIMVGSPRGIFPGGISGIEVDSLACTESLGTTNETILGATTQEQRLDCLANSTGLVYQCNLNEPDCGPVLGNGDPRSPDGYLFDRIGNDPNIHTTTIPAEDGDEVKDRQLMGFTVYSKGGVFVACAPFWKHVGNMGGPQPRGRCVYSSKKTLTDFTILLPCISGNRLNQNMGGYCGTGFGVGIKQGVSSTEIAIGTPGRYFSQGGVAYYKNASDHSTISGFKQATVDPSVGEIDIVGRKDYNNTPIPSETVGYYGFSFTEGYITKDLNTTFFLVGAPRYDQYHSTGYVYILPHNNTYFSPPVETLKGMQFGEMFGYSIEAVDLNNDGYDDVIVGAPIYSGEFTIEIGRIFIFENNQGNGFLNATTINGFTDYSRFGTALTAIGDINNDGYKDFAVSAPYEGSGVVYIYYGQPRDSTGSIVDKQYKQRIDGAVFADTVTGLDSVEMFGHSLSGAVDIDNNQFNDLVVGAYESQVVFVFRSRPVAAVNVSVTSNLSVYNCSLRNQTIPCLNISICALYHSGKNAADVFNASYRIEETNMPHRFYFENETITTETGQVTLKLNESTCFDTNIHIMLTSESVAPFNLAVDILNEERPTVNTSFIPTNDLTEQPFISSGTQRIQGLITDIPIIPPPPYTPPVTVVTASYLTTSSDTVEVIIPITETVEVNTSITQAATSSHHATTTTVTMSTANGSLTTDTTISEGAVIGAVIGSILAVFIAVTLVICLIAFFIVFRHRNKKQNPDVGPNNSSTMIMIPQSNKDEVLKQRDFEDTDSLSLEVFKMDEDGAKASKSNLTCLIQPSNLGVIEQIGQGNFGVVYRGSLMKYSKDKVEMTQVAVKTFSKGNHPPNDKLIARAEKMVHFDHYNVLSLTGICVGLFESPCLIMPYMSNGSLLSYLRRDAPNLISSKSADENLLLSMCLQVANGMAYLAVEKKFVHRNLAARNCMISSDGVIKIAGFGLAEDVYTTEYFNDKEDFVSDQLPIKWMALESIHYGKFSEKTDVWSYGILCWEVFSADKTPYPGMSVGEVVRMLDSGERLDQPTTPTCTEEVYSLMLSCWNHSSKKRPCFSELVEIIDEELN